jgi:pyruvate/2-oxoglutarate dehydrogenase complex dihydrolipoamide acyltransferase (E2) component
MPTDVVMPQMGESIAEGTIVRWIKKVGDQVARDELLFEISTDKVDAEIPSPAAGVLSEIRVKEGETVPVNSVVAVIAPAGEQTEKAAVPPPSVPAPASTPVTPTPAPSARGDGAPSAASRIERRARATPACFVIHADCRGEPKCGRAHRGQNPPALVTACPENREGQRRRHLADPGHWDCGSRDEG